MQYENVRKYIRENGCIVAWWRGVSDKVASERDNIKN